MFRPNFLLWMFVLIPFQSVYSFFSDTLLTKHPSKYASSHYPGVNWHIEIKILSSKNQTPHIAEIPFTMSGNLVLVEAEVNGQKGFFILDSGAPGLKINTVHCKPINANSLSENENAGITGEVGQVFLQTIRKFAWNHILIKNVQVESFDLSHVESAKQHKILGLIGYEIFKDYEMLLDYKAFQIVLYELNQNGDRLASRSIDTPPTDTTSFKLVGHIPVLKVKIDAFQLRFGLDTGAELNVLSVGINSKVLQHFKITKRFFLNGNGKEKLEVLGGKIPLVSVGKVNYTNMRAILTDMSKMNKAYGLTLDGILGYEFLYRNQTSINFRKQILYIWQSTPAIPIVSK
jgi:hypothetical protein